MPGKLTIVSDFVCPYCYWLEALLDRLEEPPEVTHVPFQLTEPPEPRVDVWNDPVRRARYAETLGPACQAQGVEMHLPPRVIPGLTRTWPFRAGASLRSGAGESLFTGRCSGPTSWRSGTSGTRPS